MLRNLIKKLITPANRSKRNPTIPRSILQKYKKGIAQ
jgi:hypothetical protein